ncbi:MAG TPA: hypothetical protein VG432_09365 [Gemmatimonadaceae bacterium]|nr:hypothetical protein [Gemmatimonadaceae bacterium]
MSVHHLIRSPHEKGRGTPADGDGLLDGRRGGAPCGEDECFRRRLLPTLLGNTVGGVVLAALINHAPVAADSR